MKNNSLKQTENPSETKKSKTIGTLKKIGIGIGLALTGVGAVLIKLQSKGKID